MGDPSSLSVTVLSAQGLKDVCTFGTMSPYAKAWISPSMKQRTPVAPNAGCTPVWRHKLILALPPNALKDMDLRLNIQIMNQGTATDTIVGSATIPLGDLLHNTGPNGIEFMAVQLQRPSGRVHGLVNFSVEIAYECLKYQDSPTSSSAVPKDIQSLSGKFINQSINQFIRNDKSLTDTAARNGHPLDTVTASRGRLFSGKGPLAALEVLGPSHNAVYRPPRKPLHIVELSVERAHDPLGPNKRSNRVGTLAFSPLVTRPIAASKGTAGCLAPDVLDSSNEETGCRHQSNANNSVDSPVYGSKGREGEDTGSSAPNFAHTMFGGVLGAILMGDAVSDGKGSVQHGGDPGHDDSGAGGNPSALPQC